MPMSLLSIAKNIEEGFASQVETGAMTQAEAKELSLIAAPFRYLNEMQSKLPGLKAFDVVCPVCSKGNVRIEQHKTYFSAGLEHDAARVSVKCDRCSYENHGTKKVVTI